MRKSNFGEEYQNNAGIDHVGISVRQTIISHYRVWLDQVIASPELYREVIELLDTATENDIIEIMINNDGGLLDTTIPLLASIRKTEAFTVGHLIGTAASAAGIIFLACDEQEVEDYASFMGHNVSHGSLGTATEVANHAAFIKQQSDAIIFDVYFGFLTEEEILSITKNNTIWLRDVEIRDRLVKRKQLLADIDAATEEEEGEQ